MYCLCISNVSLMYWQCICKLCLTPLFSSLYVLEMYLIGLFQCIGHVFTMQYIPIHHRGTGMYYKMYCDVFTDVLGCIWWGILVHVQDENTSQYSWQYITIHRGIHHNTSKIQWLGTNVLTFFGFPTFISDFVRLCPTLSDFVRLCPKWFPNWCRRLFHSEMDRDRAPVAPLMFPTIFLERTYLGMFTEAVYYWVSGGHCPIIETIQVQLPYNWNNSSYNSCMIRVDAGRPWRPVAKHKTWNGLVHPRMATFYDWFSAFLRWFLLPSRHECLDILCGTVLWCIL